MPGAADSRVCEARVMQHQSEGGCHRSVLGLSAFIPLAPVHEQRAERALRVAVPRQEHLPLEARRQPRQRPRPPRHLRHAECQLWHKARRTPQQRTSACTPGSRKTLLMEAWRQARRGL